MDDTTTENPLCVAQAREGLTFTQPLPFRELFEKVQQTLSVKKVFVFTPDGRGGYALREVGSLQLSFVALSEQPQPPAPLPPIDPPLPAVQAPAYRLDEDPPEDEEEGEDTSLDIALSAKRPEGAVVGVAPTVKKKAKKRKQPKKKIIESQPDRAVGLASGSMSTDGFIPAQAWEEDQHSYIGGWKD